MVDRLEKLSRTFAYVLRHRPDSIGIELDGAGWVDVDAFLAAMNASGYMMSQVDLDAVVAGDDKSRYEIVDGRIRASQGHSLDVELGLKPTAPPATLYHGTVERFIESIRRDGLVSGQRTHVHLSGDTATAREVGGRRGKAIILEIDAARMHADGHEFLLASNGVWLVEQVPVLYIAFRHI